MCGAAQAPAPTLLSHRQQAEAGARPPTAQDSGSVWSRARVQYAVTRNLILRGNGGGGGGASADSAGCHDLASGPAESAASRRAGSAGPGKNPTSRVQPPSQSIAGGAGCAPQQPSGETAEAGDGVRASGWLGGRGRLGLRAVQLLIARSLPLQLGDVAGGAEGLPVLAARVDRLRCAPGAARIVNQRSKKPVFHRRHPHLRTGCRVRLGGQGEGNVFTSDVTVIHRALQRGIPCCWQYVLPRLECLGL